MKKEQSLKSKSKKKSSFKKILIITVILIILLLILIITITNQIITGKIIEDKIDIYCHTKAICDENNICQDYEITCQGNKTISAKPITGSVVEFNIDWKDPRGENNENLCS